MPVLVIVLAMGLVAMVGMRVYESRTEAKNNADSKSGTNTTTASQTQTDATNASDLPLAANEQSSAQVDWKVYTNADRGFSFSYPGNWGEPVTTDDSGNLEITEADTNVRVTFPQNDHVTIKAFLQNAPRSTTGDSPVCGNNKLSALIPDDSYFSQGLLTKDVQTTSNEKRAAATFDISGDVGSAVYHHTLQSGSYYYLREVYEYSPVYQGTGFCPGYSIFGAKKFASDKRMGAVVISWYQYGTKCCESRPTTEEYEAFKANKDSVLSAGDRENLTAVFTTLNPYPY